MNNDNNGFMVLNPIFILIFLYNYWLTCYDFNFKRWDVLKNIYGDSVMFWLNEANTELSKKIVLYLS